MVEEVEEVGVEGLCVCRVSGAQGPKGPTLANAIAAARYGHQITLHIRHCKVSTPILNCPRCFDEMPKLTANGHAQTEAKKQSYASILSQYIHRYS